MERINTRKDLVRWITDRYGDTAPTDLDIDRIYNYLISMGFRWGDTIGTEEEGSMYYTCDIPDEVFWGE